MANLQHGEKCHSQCIDKTTFKQSFYVLCACTLSMINSQKCFNTTFPKIRHWYLNLEVDLAKVRLLNSAWQLHLRWKSSFPEVENETVNHGDCSFKSPMTSNGCTIEVQLMPFPSFYLGDLNKLYFKCMSLSFTGKCYLCMHSISSPSVSESHFWKTIWLQQTWMKLNQVHWQNSFLKV